MVIDLYFIVRDYTADPKLFAPGEGFMPGELLLTAVVFSLEG